MTSYGTINPFVVENIETLKQMMNFYREPTVLQFDSIIKLDMPIFNEKHHIHQSSHLLSWAHAGVKHFPWLLEQTQHLAYIERAYNFTEYYDYLKLMNTKDVDEWTYNAHKIIEMLLLKYGASGEMSYVDKARYITRGQQELERRINKIMRI